MGTLLPTACIYEDNRTYVCTAELLAFGTNRSLPKPTYGRYEPSICIKPPMCHMNLDIGG